MKKNNIQSSTKTKATLLLRQVPPFSTLTMQKNTIAKPFVSTMKQSTNDIKKCVSPFRRQYDNGDLPFRLDHRQSSIGIVWLIDDHHNLSIDRYLTTIASGLVHCDHPYRYLAETVFEYLLDSTINNTHRSAQLLSQLPSIITSIRCALMCVDIDKQRSMLRLLAKLSSCDGCGPALIPYYRQLLPPLRFLMQQQQQKPNCVYNVEYNKSTVDIIESTLNKLQQTGGPNSYIHIKYIIPTYESCI